MTQEELRLKITTLADTVGLEKAAVALEKLDAEAKSAGGATSNASDSMKAMNAISAASSGSITGMVGAVGKLSGSLQSLQAAVPYIAAIAAAFMAAKKILEALDEKQADFQKALSGIQTDNAKNAVDNLAKSYERLKTALTDAYDKTNDLMELEKSMIEVAKTNALQQEDLRLAKAIAGTTDPAERARLEAESAQNKARIDTKFQAEADAIQEEQLRRAIEKAEADKELAAQTKASGIATVTRMNAQQSHAQSRAMGEESDFKAVDFFRGNFSRESRQDVAYARRKEEINSYAEAREKAAATVVKAAQDEKDAEHNILVARERLNQFQTTKQSNAMRAETAGISADTRSADVLRNQAEEAERNRLRELMQQSREEKSSLAKERAARQKAMDEEAKNQRRAADDAAKIADKARGTKGGAAAMEDARRLNEAAERLEADAARFSQGTVQALERMDANYRELQRRTDNIGRRSAL